MIRTPAVAGYFYPSDPAELKKEIQSYLVGTNKQSARAIVVPHAGYMYSGHVAGAVYASVELPETFIILCPNHTGQGSAFDVYPNGEWLTPLGASAVDEELTESLVRLFPRAHVDGKAHIREHSLEVQLPFLQFLKKKITFLPVCIRQFQYEFLQEMGEAIAEIIKKDQRDILLISSTDMTHYESQKSANRKDNLAIEKMKDVDAKGLYDIVNEEDISMCGYLPTTVTLIASKKLGATQAGLVKYATSGDITKDYDSVVGYAGMVVT